MANRLAEYDTPHLPAAAWRSGSPPKNQDMQQRMNPLLKQGSRWIVEHPEIALASAVITGVVIGWLIKRR